MNQQTGSGAPPPEAAGQRADQDFARVAGDLLRETAAALDAPTAARLNRARQAALREWPAPWRRPMAGWGLAGVTAAGLLAVALFVGRGPTPTGPGSAVPLPGFTEPADLDLLLVEREAPDSLALMEDLDFYAWLESALPAESPADGSG